MNNERFCDYGCGQIAKYQLSTGKWCCSPTLNKCPEIKKKNSTSKDLIRICPHCNEKFHVSNGRIFSNHVRWCKKNPKVKEIREHASFIAKTKVSQKSAISKYGNYKDFNVKCSVCGKDLTVSEREKLFPRKENYFCSEKCRRSYRKNPGKSMIFTLTCINCNKKFISKKSKCQFCSELCEREYCEKNPDFINKESLNRKHSKYFNFKTKLYDLVCKQCGKSFTSTAYKEYCCKECSRLHLSQSIKNIRKKKRLEKFSNTEEEKKEKLRLEIYKFECSFTFSLNDYPDEFDFDLIRKYGWYKAKNHGDNLNGVSRDHMFSIMEGFRQNIDPKIISHPANCRLVRHNDNVSKRDKCSITLNELIQKIEQWNKKYKC